MNEGIPVVTSWVQVATLAGVAAIILTKLVFYPLILRRTKRAEETYDMVRGLVTVLQSKESRADRTQAAAVKTLAAVRETVAVVQDTAAEVRNVVAGGVSPSQSGTGLKTVNPPDPINPI